MRSKIVKQFMVPIAEYATVSEEATLLEAVVALEETQTKHHMGTYVHQAVLVYNADKEIIGKIGQLDVLRALEPRYDKMGDRSSLTRFGLSREFLKGMFEQFDLLHKPLDDICRKSGRLKVKNFMYTPTEGEYIEETASLNEAIHQLIMGSHRSLLVLNEKKNIVGILKLTDVFAEVCTIVKECEK